MSPALYHYRGRRRGHKSVSSVGAQQFGPGQLAEWVEKCYRAGWRELTVTRNGETVAEIGPDIDRPNRRSWWSE